MHFLDDMRRAMNTIGLILLGALASGIGAGFFLHRANTDRSALIAQAEEAKQKADEVARSGQAVTDEANRKLDEAAQAVTRANERVRALEEERLWFTKAEILTPPRITSTWKEWLNYTHGFTVKLPTHITETKNNADGFESPWLTIKPYKDEPIRLETAYAVKGRLLIGYRDEAAWIFRVQSGGAVTHLVTVYPNPRVSERTLLEALSTLTFRDE